MKEMLVVIEVVDEDIADVFEVSEMELAEALAEEMSDEEFFYVVRKVMMSEEEIAEFL